MTVDVPIRCSCGAVRGTVNGISGENSNRLVCYCNDCQSFAHFLGRADELLDLHGGTDVFQITASHVQVTAGAEQLACMRLTAKGLVRWYTGCCNTPFANTFASGRVPFAGMIHSCMDHSAMDRSPDESIGPVRARINGRFAKADRSGRGAPLDAHRRAPISMLRFIPILYRGWRNGEHAPSPFFDADTKNLRVVPRVLTKDELRKVEAARDATPSVSDSGRDSADGSAPN